MKAALLAVVLGCAVAVSGCTGGGKTDSAPTRAELNGHTDSMYQGVGLTPPQPRPQFTLTDTAGKLRDTAGSYDTSDQAEAQTFTTIEGEL